MHEQPPQMYGPYDEAMGVRFELEQTDLQTLCSDRALSTSELFWQNDAYCGASILKRYANLPQSTRIRAIVPHGVYGDAAYDWEMGSRLPAALVYPPYRMQPYRERGIVPVPSAAPFVYANEMVTYSGPREGTLFSPSHSTVWATVEMDFERLADRLLDFPSWMQPISVMCYWRDIQLGNHLPFVNRGLRVVSAGHWYDPDFLLRLSYLLRQHRHASSNAYGSYLFYSVWAGCSFHFLHQEHSYTGDEEKLREELATPSSEDVRRHEELQGLFSSPTISASREQQDTARYYVGGDYLKEPAELADLIKWLRRLDRMGSLAFVLDGANAPIEYEHSGLGAAVPYSLRRLWFDSPRLLLSIPLGAARILYRRCPPLQRWWRGRKSRNGLDATP